MRLSPIRRVEQSLSPIRRVTGRGLIPPISEQSPPQPKPKPKHKPPKVKLQPILDVPEFDTSKAIHAYRHLLRELSYIPDDFARRCLKSQITERFRINPSKQKIFNERVSKARASAKRIERAVHGSVDDLEKVLMHAYGRLGKRRRDFMQKLLRPKEGDTLDEKTTRRFTLRDGTPAVGNMPTQRSINLLKSQRKQMAALNEYATRSKIRSLQPSLPSENIWGRSLPVKRQKNLIRAWWSDTLERIHAPLPQADWDRLRDLAEGKIKVPERIPRRTAIKKQVEIEEEHQNILQKLKNSKSGGNIVFDENKGLTIEDPREKSPELVPQNYQRTMRRLYEGIWEISPLLKKNKETKEWDVVWGGKQDGWEAGKVEKASGRDGELFEGLSGELEAKGKSDKKGRRRQTRPTTETSPATKTSPAIETSPTTETFLTNSILKPASFKLKT